MGIGGALRDLGRYLDECEQRRQVDSVDLADDGSPEAAGRVTADIELTLSPCPSGTESRDMSLRGTNVGDDGRLRLTFETVDALVPERPDAVELEPDTATFGPDGTVSVTLTASTSVADRAAVDDGDGADGGTTAEGSDEDAPDPDESSTDRSSDTDGTDDPTDRETDGPNERESDDSVEVVSEDPTGPRTDSDVPPFRDHELLRAVYESCDTFAEMSGAIEMDVTAETVRRYMIDADIHEPETYDTAGAAEPGSEPTEAEAELRSPVVLTDGIGLPDDVSVDTVVETVRSSSTIYEVQNDIGVGREEALEMLQELDLLGHVIGRLATKDERGVSRELVVERLRQNAEPR